MITMELYSISRGRSQKWSAMLIVSYQGYILSALLSLTFINWFKVMSFRVRHCNIYLIYFPLFKLCFLKVIQFSSVQSLSHVRLCNPMNHNMPGLPVHHQLPEFTQTHVHQVSDAIQPSHPLSSPSPPAPNPSQHQSLFQWVNSSHEVAKVLEFQLQHQSFQWTPRTDLV